jgi:beta-lactamase class A
VKYFLLIVSLCILQPVFSQTTDKKLQKQLETMIAGFNGNIGIYVHDLKHNKTAAIHADTIFPTASIVKLQILMGVMDKLDKGELLYHGRETYTDSLHYSEGDDILASFRPGETIETSKLMMLMLSTSDNCASLWLQGLSGGGKRINQIMDSLGYRDTRVNSRTPGRENNRNQYGWGQSTPRETAHLMQSIVEGKIYDKADCDRMTRLLGRQYWDEEALSQIPPDVYVADKNGAVDESRNEIMFVNGKETPYIVSIFTKNNKDTIWQYNNEAWVLTRKISAYLWKYFNPGSIWVSPYPVKKEGE